MPQQNGAALIAKSLQGLGVKVIFGLVGIPVVEIAEEAIALGIRFIAFRNEQAASYAATAYGYLAGKPGICLVVGGPGLLHAMAGVGNSSINHWPMLLLAGSCDTHLATKGAFQELDAISLLSPHTKLAVRSSINNLSQSISKAYLAASYGRGGTGFVDLPANVIQDKTESEQSPGQMVQAVIKAASFHGKIDMVANLLRSAEAPLVVIGKGAAHARAESMIRRLIDSTRLPFLPTPMGKGVLPDSHPSNAASARSAALKSADIVLVLGARLNWILHFGEEPKWSPTVKFIQIDISAEEIGKTLRSAEYGIVGDVSAITSQISDALQGWQFDDSSLYAEALRASKEKNEATAARLSIVDTLPMTYQRAFDVVKRALHRLSPPEDGNIVYVSEGANTMDISRSIFPVEYPRLRLDAGTHATMGVGLGYAIAAHHAYNVPEPEGYAGPSKSRKKIVCIEGDSAFGFSMAEVETMSRYCMDVLIFVLNNGGIYHGDCSEGDEWLKLQEKSKNGHPGGLRSTGLGWEVKYEQMAEMCGGKGYLARTPRELEKATEEGFRADVPVVVNVMIEPGHAKKLVGRTIMSRKESETLTRTKDFAWQTYTPERKRP